MPDILCLLSSVDFDTPHLSLSLGRLGQVYRQDALVIPGLNLLVGCLERKASR